MLRHQGGDNVKAGFYFNLDSWDINTMSGKDGGTLQGDESARYLRIPVIGMLCLAPLLGAAFAMFLPFIGIALVAQYIALRTWQGAQHAAHAMVTTLGPSWQPSAAHLTGTPDEKKQNVVEGTTRAADARLDSLEREIAEQAERSKTSRA